MRPIHRTMEGVSLAVIALLVGAARAAAYEVWALDQSTNLTMSPDGRYAFITLRGPEQRSGPHAIAGDTPGVAVLDIATRESVTILEPDRAHPKSDFHGVGLRPLDP